MLKNLEGIYIEESLADPYSVGHRYRYTLAHEIGHRIFHGEIIKSLPFKYVGEYAECMRNINPKTYSRMEYQAYFFAGFLIVPSDLLKSEFQMIYVSLKDEGYETTLQLVCKTPTFLKEVTGMEKDKCGIAFRFMKDRLIEAGLLNQSTMKATELLKLRKQIKRVKIGCKSLDDLLGGGWVAFRGVDA